MACSRHVIVSANTHRKLADGCYKTTTYYLAKFIEEAVLATFTSLLFGLIVFWAASLQGSFIGT